MRATDVADMLEYQCNILCVVDVWRWIGHADVLTCRSPEADCVLGHKHRLEVLGYTRDSE